MENILARLLDHQIITSRQARIIRGIIQQETARVGQGKALVRASLVRALLLFCCSSRAISGGSEMLVKNVAYSQLLSVLYRWKTASRQRSIFVKDVRRATAVALWVVLIQNILANMFDLPKMWGKVTAVDDRRCPTSRLYSAGHPKSGAARLCDCYDVYRSELDTLLRRIHPTNRHVGKIPRCQSC